MARSNKVLIDTNVLVYMYEHKRDIFDYVSEIISGAEFFILDKSVIELEKVYKEKPRKLDAIKRYLKKMEDAKKYAIINVDDGLYKKNFCKIDRLLIYFSKDYLIYTNDVRLKKKIKEKNGQTITLREYGALIE